MGQKRRGDSDSLNAAIRTLEQIRKRDSNGTTGYPSRAAAEIREIKRTLARTAAPRIAAGRQAKDDLKWLRARKELLRAVKINPYSKEGARLLAEVEKECTHSAKLAFQKAQVYEEINNFSGAREQCQIAMRYHPQRRDEYNLKCREMMERLDRKQEGLR